MSDMGGVGRRLENLSVPEHSEEIGRIDELLVFGDSGDWVKGYENQPTVGVLFLEHSQPSLVLCFDQFAGLYFNRDFCVTYDGIDFMTIVCVPIGNGLSPFEIASVSDDFLHYKMFECMAVIVSSTFQSVPSHKVIRKPDIKIIEFGRLNHFPFDNLCIGGFLLAK